jgi:hypothetical protein
MRVGKFWAAFAAVLLLAGAAAAADGKKVAKKASGKAAKTKQVAKAVEPVESDGGRTKAIEACEKHVGNMLVGSDTTEFGRGSDLRVEPAGDTFKVSGLVTSKAKGAVRRAEYSCAAERFGSVWATKTSLAFQP